MCKLKHKTGKHNDARGHDVTTLQFILLVCVLIEEIQKVYILIGLCVCIRICESISWRNTFGPIKLQLACLNGYYFCGWSPWQHNGLGLTFNN